MLRDNVDWKWSDREQKAFDTLKEKLSDAPVLTHFSEKLPLKLDTDASNYGIGAVISHIYPSGEERPIAYASRTLNKSERNYPQIEKEALSIVFGVRKFHQYLYGRKFILVTDHKPLVSLLGPKTGIPTLAAARMQRWALLLSGYQYDIEYRSTHKHANADCLSRLPLNDHVRNEIHQLQLESLPVSVDQVRKATRSDPILSRVLEYALTGWPTEVTSEAIKPYFNKRNEITVEENCLLWGMRVVIPRPLQARVLDELHEGHPGIVRMKALARAHVWWPGLDTNIANTVRGCLSCQSVRNRPPQAPLQPWFWPKVPWERIHVDFAGPFMNKMFMIAVDSHSKWLEIEIMPNVTSETTIEKLRDMFARYGLPERLVSDNGPQFTSSEFATFMKRNGIKHILVAPYHPRSNGQAERFVQTFKQFFKAEGKTSASLNSNLARFLFSYRTTPNSTTGQTPAELFFSRRLRTRLDLLRPDLSRKTASKQSEQKMQHDMHAKERNFEVGESVLVENFRGQPKWLKATVTEKTGPVSFRVMLEDGEICRRHVDQMHEFNERFERSDNASANMTPSDNPVTPGSIALPEITQASETEASNAEPQSDASAPSVATPELADTPAAQIPTMPRYPSRERKPPVRLGFDIFVTTSELTMVGLLLFVAKFKKYLYSHLTKYICIQGIILHPATVYLWSFKE